MEGIFFNSLYLVLPLIIVLVLLNIIYFLCKILCKKSGYNKSKKKISIIKTLLIPLLLLIFMMPAIYLIGSVFFDVKARINRIAIHNIAERNEHINIMADDMILQFANNLAEADNFYKNKVIQITGTIYYVGIPKDNPPLKDNSYILLSGLDGNGINCYFTNNKQVPELKWKKENESITIMGKYRGSIINNGITISLGDCEIINE